MAPSRAFQPWHMMGRGVPTFWRLRGFPAFFTASPNRWLIKRMKTLSSIHSHVKHRRPVLGKTCFITTCSCEQIQISYMPKAVVHAEANNTVPSYQMSKICIVMGTVLNIRHSPPPPPPVDLSACLLQQVVWPSDLTRQKSTGFL